MTGPPPFDPNTASIEALLAQYPDLGLFAAEDLVAWRTKNGRFESAAPLIELGLSVELAAQLVAPIGEAEPAVLEVPRAESATAAPSLAPIARSVAPRKIVEEGDVRPSIKPEALPTMYPSLVPAPSIAPVLLPASPYAEAHPSAPSLGEEATSSTLDVAPDGASIRTMLAAPSTIPAPPEPPAPDASSIPSVRRSRAVSIALVALAMVNAALVAGLVALRSEEQHAHAPVAAMSVEVRALHAKQTDDTARIEDTRARLEKQNDALANTIERVNAVELRQHEADREMKDAADREAKRTAELGARLGRVEKQVGEAYTLAEALEIIDLSREDAPAPRASPKQKSKAPGRPRGTTDAPAR